MAHGLVRCCPLAAHRAGRQAKSIRSTTANSACFMNTTAMLIALFVLLPAFGIAAWAWINLARLDHDMRFAAGLDGMDFEIHDSAVAVQKGSAWPTPG